MEHLCGSHLTENGECGANGAGDGVCSATCDNEGGLFP